MAKTSWKDMLNDIKVSNVFLMQDTPLGDAVVLLIKMASRSGKLDGDDKPRNEFFRALVSYLEEKDDFKGVKPQRCTIGYDPFTPTYERNEVVIEDIVATCIRPLCGVGHPPAVMSSPNEPQPVVG